jgi:hypothetical protein
MPIRRRCRAEGRKREQPSEHNGTSAVVPLARNGAFLGNSPAMCTLSGSGSYALAGQGMPSIPTSAVILILVALAVFTVLIIVGRGGRLRSFQLSMLKDLFKLRGTLDTQHDTPGSDVRSSEHHDLAHRIIAWLREQQPQRVRGSYVLTETTHDNAQTAARLYSKVNGYIIGTCFFESPFYGRGDFASNIDENSTFVRITKAEVCDDATARDTRAVLDGFSCKAELVVIPEEVEVSRIGGIFCYLRDRSYLAFMALNNVENSGANRGLVFSGTLAEELFQYLKGFADRVVR